MTPHPGNADLTYDAICKVLSDHQEQACTAKSPANGSGEHGRSVNWEQFGEDEWRLMAAMAKTEGVAPLMHWKLGRTDDGGWKTDLPAAVREHLKASYYATTARNALLFRELDEDLPGFRKPGRSGIPLESGRWSPDGLPRPGPSTNGGFGFVG